MTISAPWTCRVAGSSKVEETTSPATDRCMSVTSSGRSSMSSTMSVTSGWLRSTEWAMDCRSIVLPGRRHDQRALALAHGGDQVHHPRGHVAGHLELQALLRVEGRQVVEEDLVPGDLGVLEVDRLDLDQGEVPLALLGLPDRAGDGVAGAQVEAPDLARGDVDVIRAGQVVVLGGTQEAEAVGQALEDPLGEDEPALLGLRLEDLEDQLLLAQRGGALDAEVLGDLGELADAHLLERKQELIFKILQ